MNKHIKQCLD